MLQTSELAAPPALSREAAPSPVHNRRPATPVWKKILRLPRTLSTRAWNKLGGLVLSAATRRGFFAGIYYAFFSRQFRREQQVFLCGRARYSRDLANPEKSAVLLRRNVHRLEKGLLMRPRRTPFALDYIEETLDCYCRAIAVQDCASRVHDDELQWACDVLTEYFAAMPDHPRVSPLRSRFSALPRPARNSRDQLVPYRRDLSKPPSVNYDDLLALAWRRRSVRWFLQKPVPRDLIDKAVAVAALSPSACNRQPFVFRVVDDPELVKRVGSIPMGLGGYGHNVPVLVVVTGRQRNYFSERDRHLIYIDGSLAAMAFVLALESLGLASCCVNWPDIEEKEAAMVRALRLDTDERPIMLIAVGFPDPDGMVAYSKKRPLEQLRQYNFEP